MIDFADRRQSWRWDLRMAGTRLFLVFGTMALLLAALAWQRAGELQAEQASLEERLARLQARQQRSAADQKRSLHAGSEDEALLRQAHLLRALPWEAVWRAFEAAPGARMESLEPDLARGVVKVRATVLEVGQVQDYLDRLQTSPVFRRVSLLRHELAADGQGVGFQYEAVLAAPYRLPDDPRGSKR
jgi:hypothetical protein